VSLYARYKFKQRPDAAIVQGLIAAELAGEVAPDGLPGAVHDLRRQMAETRRHLPTWRGEDSAALLKDLARIDRQLGECEEAVDLILAGMGDQPKGRARCPRCHRQAPTVGNRIAAHASGSRGCSGTGTRLGIDVGLITARFKDARSIVALDEFALLEGVDPLVTVVRRKVGGRYSIDSGLAERADVVLETRADGSYEVHKDRHGPAGVYTEGLRRRGYSRCLPGRARTA